MNQSDFKPLTFSRGVCARCQSDPATAALTQFELKKHRIVLQRGYAEMVGHTPRENDGHKVLATRDGRGGPIIRYPISHWPLRSVSLRVANYNSLETSAREQAIAGAYRRCGAAVLFISLSHPMKDLKAYLATHARHFPAKRFRHPDLLRKTTDLYQPGSAPADPFISETSIGPIK
jgi:hypothetical protein